MSGDAARSYEEYSAALSPELRSMLDRVHDLVLDVVPDVEVRISYGIPTYVVGKRRFHMGAWKHGISLYGWDSAAGRRLLQAHPGLVVHGKSTIRLRPHDLAAVTDAELVDLVAATLLTD